METSNNLSPEDGLQAVHQNGGHEEQPNSVEDSVVLNVDPIATEISETVIPNGSFENFNQLDSNANDNSSMAEIKEGLDDKIYENNVSISKEEEVEIIDETEQVRVPKGPAKNKNAKAPSPRGAHVSSLKKSKDGKEKETASSVSNGTLAVDSHIRQPIKNKSFNDKQTRLSKHPGKLDAASSEAPVEKTRPQLLKKGPLDNQGKEEPSSPTAEDEKPGRAGALPNYGFSFKCDERAQRRREFYSKLEEKIHAKEVEESNMQAKTKESQEAEIKKLRKKLAFKATPMPSFYQEPPPPRVELKKIPTTRAKSPKLGRNKSSTEGNTNSSAARQVRASLDEKVFQNSPTKGINPVQQKKPLRRSLPPRLTAERISSSKPATVSTSSKAVNGEKTLSNSTGEEKVEMIAATDENNNALSNEMSEALPLNVETVEVQPHVNHEIVIEEKPLVASVQEPIAAEH